MAAIIEAHKLIEKAQKGVRLNSKERRHCVAFLMATAPEYTQSELATLFQVSDRMIRLDIDKIKEERAKLIRDEDISLVIADIALSFDKQVRDLEASKRQCKRGTNTFANHCKLIFTMQLKKVEALQALGYYPRNLGNMTVQRWDYKAIVGKDGGVNTGPAELTQADLVEPFDAEFEDVKDKLALPAPENIAFPPADLSPSDDLDDEESR